MLQYLNSKLFCGNTNIVSYDSEKTSLKNSDIKLFKIKLSNYQGLIADFIKILIPTEISRAQSYYFEKDRNRFIICRALLKFILAEETGLDVFKIDIKTDRNKKPYLLSQPQLFFNMSHVGDYAVIALDKNNIGVDIELLDKHHNIIEMMPQVFSKREIDFVLNAVDKKYTFYKFWTRKEAIVKASGKGIDNDFLKIPSLDGFHFIKPSLLDGIQNLQVLSFDLDQHCIGAIAYEHKELYLKKLVFYPIPLYSKISTDLKKTKNPFQ